MPFRSHAAPLAALLLTALIAVPGHAADFTDSAGRHVAVPDHVARVLTASPAADTLVFALAPEELLGWSRAPRPPFLPPRTDRLPVTGLTLGPNPSIGAAIVRRMRPDLIIAAGPITPARAAFAEELQRQSGVPCILIDDSFVRMPTMLRSVGRVLGVPTRAQDLALYAENAISALHGRLLIQPADARPRVYYGRGPDGLVPSPPGSPAGAAIDEAGAINVSATAGPGWVARVTRRQVIDWNPDVVIAEERPFYDQVLRDPAWSGVAAVRDRRVFLAPASPFGWIGDPAGVNRLIGLYWLSDIFYPDATQEDIADTASDFYSRFYREKLTTAQLDALVKAARAPRKPGQKEPTEALLGVGPQPTTGTSPRLPPMPTTQTPTGPLETIPGGRLHY